MVWQDWIGVGIAIVGAFGLGTLFNDWRQRKFSGEEAERQRQHASAEARAARNFDLRLRAYTDISIYLSRQERWVNLTEPVWGPPADAPEEMRPDDQWVALGAMIAISASDRVREVLRAAADRHVEFEFRVEEYRRSRKPGYTPEPDENPGVAMHAARVATIEAIHLAQTTMRDELAEF